MTPCPVPKPRRSRQTTPSHQPSPPVAKPRTVHLISLTVPEEPSSPTPAEEGSKARPDSRPKQSLRKLQLTAEEKTQLVNLHSFSADSDSETHGGSSSCSSSSANAGPPKTEGLDGQEEEGYWSGSTAGQMREKRNRRCFRRKEMPSGQARVRSKFSPWNLSSPRISRDTRLSVHVNQPGRVGKLATHLFGAQSGITRAYCNTYSYFFPQKQHSDMSTRPQKRASKEMTTTTMMRTMMNKTLTCLMTK